MLQLGWTCVTVLSASSSGYLRYWLFCGLALQRNINMHPCPQVNHGSVSPDSYSQSWDRAVQRWNGGLPWDVALSQRGQVGQAERGTQPDEYMAGIWQRLRQRRSSWCNDVHGPFSLLEALVCTGDSGFRADCLEPSLKWAAWSHVHIRPTKGQGTAENYTWTWPWCGDSAFCGGNVSHRLMAGHWHSLWNVTFLSCVN